MASAAPSDTDKEDDKLLNIESRRDTSDRNSYYDPDSDDDGRPVSRLSEVSSVASISSEKASDPWPYLSKYFEFISRIGNRVKYKCVLCLPKERILTLVCATI
jgi:hypothetical protein